MVPKDKTPSGKAMITIKWSDSEEEKGEDAKVGAWKRKGDISVSL